MIGVNICLGTIVLLFGRKLFWAFVAIGGLLVGMEVAGIALAGGAVWLQLLVGVAFGLLGAIVGIFAQRLEFALAGFYALGYVGMAAGEMLLPGSNLLVWLVAAGLCGAVIAALLMDWAIVVLSSFVGAAAVSTELAVAPPLGAFVFFVLIVIGIAFQSRSVRRDRRDSGHTHGNMQAAA